MMMQPAVRAAWLAWNRPIENRVSWMYLDVRGLVTTGVGQLIDPVAAAMDLPFARPDGSAAARGEIMVEWLDVKKNLALAHEGAEAAERITTLRLPDAAIDADAMARLDRNELILRAWPDFAAFEAWPADAQLGILSMAWAMGPGFPRGYPRFSAAAAAGDWAAAANECLISTAGNPGVAARNSANKAAFAFAINGTDPAKLLSPVPAAAA